MAIDISTLATATGTQKGFIVKGADGKSQLVMYDAGYVKRTSDNKLLTAILSDLETALSGLQATVNTFLTGEDNENDVIDRLSELIKAINDNKDSIDDLLTDKVNKSDIINDLTTGGTDKVLSAEQGKALKTSLDTLSNTVSSTKLQAKVITTLPDTDTWPEDMADNGVLLYVPASA